jgi:hypothetical protein
LVSGNKFRVIDSSNNNRGDYVVSDRLNINSFTALTPAIGSVNNGYILKHGLSANGASSDSDAENLGTRSVTFFDKETLVTNSGIDTTTTTVPVSNTYAEITKRFPLGSYIQIDEEIMRVATSTLTIPSGGTVGIRVIRGVLATKQVAHDSGSLVRKIKPIPIEFRRPSIVRASGHTFEYLGYGPGNYSTGLPQVQVIPLTEREEFLVQSQERSGGIVVYTGMNNNGDSFIGNRKTSSATGEEITFDNPIPTVTGEDPSRLSVIFDEVTVKERLVVEGGNSGNVLSQFDGPVTFNKEIKVNANVNIKLQLKLSNQQDSTSTANGALVVSGGAGIAKNLNVGGTLNVTGATTLSSTLGVTGATTLTGLLDANGGATIDNVRIGVAGNNEIDTSSGNLTIDSAGGTTTIDDNLTVSGATTLSSTLGVTGATTLTGLLDANGGATIDNVRIGVAGNNEIDTSTGNLTIDSAGGTTTIDDNLTVSGTSTIDDNLTVSGTSTFNGPVELGNQTSDTVTFTARVDSNILPSTTETYNLGSATRKWNNVYANTFVGALSGAVTGNADSATRLLNARNFRITGDVDAPAVSFDGTGNVNLVTTLDNTGVSAATYGSATAVPQITVDAKGRITAASVANIEQTGGSSSQVIYRNSSNALTGSSNLTFDGTNLSVGGDITAFASDERLKENIQPLENALDKVLALNGFTYNFNEIGQSLGFDGKITYVGVSAQQVQAVLPEAVKPAPADSKYITVQYEKLIPLLIEAIKELKAEINELKGVK